MYTVLDNEYGFLLICKSTELICFTVDDETSLASLHFYNICFLVPQWKHVAVLPSLVKTPLVVSSQNPSNIFNCTFK